MNRRHRYSRFLECEVFGDPSIFGDMVRFWPRFAGGRADHFHQTPISVLG